jgi:polysaccharide export outer membrane protein
MVLVLGILIIPHAHAGYVIGADDVLYIQLYGDPSMTGLWEVREDGNIKYPLLGEIKAAGCSLEEFNDNLTSALTKYYKDPQVTVTVESYGSCKVFILGQVYKPGVYYYKREATVLEALLLAGGISESGKKNSVIVVRQLESTPQIMRVNIESVVEDGMLAFNIPVKPMDIIFVPKTFIANLNDFLTKLYPSMLTYINLNSIYRIEWTR